MFCFKELSFSLSGVSLKAIFYCFALNHTFLHVSCVLLASKFYATTHGFIQNCFQCNQMLSNVVKTLKSIFLQYDVLFRTCSLPFRAYLVHFVRSFLCFATKPLVLVITGLFDHVFKHSNAINTKLFQCI